MSGVSVEHGALRTLARTMLLAMGSEPAEATIVSDHLVDANLSGHDSHGVGLLPMYVRDRLAGNVTANLHPTLLRDDGVIGVFDAAFGFGHVAAREATVWGIAREQDKGVAIVSLRDAYHLARVGTYGEQACAAGLISIVFVNVVSTGLPKVAPFGGVDGRLQTNPICIGIPAGDDLPPFVLDFATSEIAMGKVRVAHNEGRRPRLGALMDSAGRPTDDPAVMFEAPFGAILPFGAHKGSGLALACELLGGALSGGPTNQTTAPRTGGVINGLFAIFIDPARFVELPYFHREIAAILAHVKASPPIDPEKPVLTAGEPERARRRARIAGGVPLDATSWREILAAARQAGVADPEALIGHSVKPTAPPSSSTS